MSFDVFFQPCRFEATSVDKRNPFTGEIQSVLHNEPLNAAELKAVQRVLKKAKAGGPNEHGCYVVEFDDGGRAEVFGSHLETCCMATLRGMTTDLCRFHYELLEARNWVMLPAMEDAMAITTSPGRMKGVPADFPRVIVCNSVEDLAVLLADGVGTWEKYRDQVVSGEP